jgi:lipopolysaccharide export system permease protein
MIRILDRYILRSWITIFGLTALGFPLVSVIINATDNLEKLLDRGLTGREIVISYVYAVPEHMSQVMPAAVLFATVFTIGALGRNSEITAAKAGGQSFLRLCFPIFIAAVFAFGLAVVVGEVAPGATIRSLELQKSRAARPTTARYNFVYRADAGWVYTVRSLDVATRSLRQMVFERQGLSADYPGLSVAADSATYSDTTRRWTLWDGMTQRVAGPGRLTTFHFRSMRLRALSQSPADLLVEPKAPDEMRYAELARYIDALKRSGNDASKLEVDWALKIALPATCLVIALFGAPLAITSPRAGTAFGIAISLGTTVMFLSLIQLSKAIGVTGIVNPIAAAWFPNVLFLAAALWLLWRART